MHFGKIDEGDVLPPAHICVAWFTDIDEVLHIKAAIRFVFLSRERTYFSPATNEKRVGMAHSITILHYAHRHKASDGRKVGAVWHWQTDIAQDRE